MIIFEIEKTELFEGGGKGIADVTMLKLVDKEPPCWFECLSPFQTERNKAIKIYTTNDLEEYIEQYAPPKYREKLLDLVRI